MVCFQNKNTNSGKIWRAYIFNVALFYDHSEYFTAISDILQPFGLVCGHLVYFFRFGMFGPRKIGQPCLKLTFYRICT
jgi:hypothetical protein